MTSLIGVLPPFVSFAQMLS
ncbi:unnamed protein product, partial [Vitis vinifera]|uniref:Uncharacterized protein n=1 Tax=Vitis vinifera TaxID=29760 RepID=D7TF05_VITVI